MNPLKTRPILLNAILMIIAIVITWEIKINNNIAIFALALLITTTFLIIFHKGQKSKIILVVINIVFFVLGLLFTSNAISFYLPGNITNDKVNIKGNINSFVSVNDKQSEFTINNCTLNGNKIKGNIKIYFNGQINAEYGDIVEAESRIRIPMPPRNPGAADGRITNWSKGIKYSASPSELKIMQGKRGLISAIFNLRKQMENALKQSMDAESYGVLKGMLFGDVKEMDDDLVIAYRDTGISHILSVSGLHVVMIASVIIALTKKLKINKTINLLIFIVLLVLYCTMSGFSPPVIRSGFAVLLAQIALYIGEKSDVLTTLSLSAIITFFINPLMLFSLGFILSYISVLGIVGFSTKTQGLFNKVFLKNSESKFYSQKAKLLELIGVSIDAQIGILPAQLYYFGTISLVATIANLLITPLITVAIALGFLSAIVGLFWLDACKVIAYFCSLALKGMTLIAQLMAKVPFATITLGSINLIAVLILTVLIILFSKWCKRNSWRKYLSVLCVISLIANIIIFKYNNRGLKAVFLDVGQGDAAYVTDGKVNILIDAGNRQGNIDYGKNVIAPFLIKQGVTNLDAVIITHPHADHVGGLLSICENVKVGSVIISGEESESDEQYKEFEKYAQSEKIKFIEVFQDDQMDIGKMIFKMYGPKTSHKDANDNSLLFNLIYEDKRIMFTGDAGFNEEREILDKLEYTDILSVAHHGSKNSTSDEFLKKVNPSVAILSVGANNIYGHPTPVVVDKLKNNQTMIYRTDNDGAITATIRDGKIIIKTMLR